MDIFKKDSEKKVAAITIKHAEEIKEGQLQCDNLQSTLNEAHGELVSAREECTNLNTQILSLQDEMMSRLKDLTGQFEAETLELETEKDNEIRVLKLEAESVRNELLKENEKLKRKLCVSEQCSEDLLKELDQTKTNLTNDLIAYKGKARQELDATLKTLYQRGTELKETEDSIKILESERKSLRTLFRIQRGLLRARIGKRFGRK